MELFIYLKIPIVTAIVAFLPLTASTNNIPDACKQVMSNHETENVHREITIYGNTRRLEVQWGSGVTNLANAALLLVVLKYVQGYKDAVLVKGSETLCELASAMPDRVEDDDSNKLVIHVGAKPPENNLDCPALYSCDDPRDLCTMAGPNLDIMGEAMPPIDPQLHVQTHEATCRKKTWRYDSSQTDLKKCNFLFLSDLKIPEPLEEKNPTLSDFLNEYRNSNCLDENNCTLVLLDLDLNNTNNKEWTKRIAKEMEHFKFKFQLIPSSAVSLNLSISKYSLFSLHLPDHPRPAYRVAPGKLLQQFAYRILYVVRRFAPTPEDIKKILDMIPLSDYENSTQDMEEAACQYFADNAYNFIDWARTSDFVPWIHVLLCKGDPDNEWYKNISGEVATTLNVFTNFTLINCSDKNAFNQEMFIRSRDMRWSHMIGMVGRGAGAALAAQAASSMETQVVLYDVPSDTAVLSGSMRTATGKVKPLTLALKHFFKQNEWRRIAIISDRTKLSVDFNKTLCDDNQALYHRERIIDSENLKTSANEILQQFSKDSAPGHIFFLNTDTTAAGELLCAAINLGMTDRKGYAWIVREWGSPPPPCNVTDIRHFTVTYWWRGGDDSYLEEREKGMRAEDPIIYYLRPKINEKSKKYKKSVWPPLTAPLVDAIMLLFYEYNVTLKSYPGLRYNLHGDGIAKNISETFTEEAEVPGIVQTLKQKDYSQESPLVFLYAWRGNSNRELLAVWKVENETVNVVSKVKETYPVLGEPAPKDGFRTCIVSTGDFYDPSCHDIPIFSGVTLVAITLILVYFHQTTFYLNQTYPVLGEPAPDDGSRNCIVPTGDPYEPSCHDIPVFSGVTLVAIILILVYFGHRYWIKKWKLREHMMQMRMLARSERRAVTLGPYLVSRSSLDTREELGTGNFGRVHFGMLTFPKQKIPVAVKSLREEASLAEESQFLHEACILSRLSHVNIVRLIGVCAADGPPLVMMEHAFFRDLCVYLRARRHYAEIEDNQMDEQEVKEASSISPLALTQLAREAASALDYLCFKKIVHRDVRAANCLVDGSRTLKLADFGMAREMSSSKTLEQDNSLAPSNGKTSFTTISEPVNYSYFCKRRRDRFPLSWMAPESVSRGEFSSATDVWSLGVMMFEIVTLGQRPFGSWSLQRVYYYLFNGGIPELPLEISYKSREVIEMCWWKEPSKRATAAAIRAHLAANPTALRHAVGRKPREERSPSNSDSGYSERTGLLTSDDPRISTY